MPIIYQYRIYRHDLLNNPRLQYVFGDNVLRVGLGRQAKEMRGAGNAIGVATKWRPSSEPEDFFSDDQFEKIKPVLDEDLNKVELALQHGGIVVLPLEGIGTGLSEMPERAPGTYRYLMVRLKALQNRYPLQR